MPCRGAARGSARAGPVLRSPTASMNAQIEPGTASATSARTSSTVTGARLAVERELVELHRRGPGLVAALDVALADEAADPVGQLLRRARAERHAPFVRLRGRSSPRDSPALGDSLQRARRRSPPTPRPWPSAVARRRRSTRFDLATVDEVDGDQRVPGRQVLQRGDEALARGLRGHGEAQVERHGERAAAEHHARPEPLEELRDWMRARFFSPPEVPALERRPGLPARAGERCRRRRSRAYSSSPQT